jgi:hypothetical protein
MARGPRIIIAATRPAILSKLENRGPVGVIGERGATATRAVGLKSVMIQSSTAGVKPTACTGLCSSPTRRSQAGAGGLLAEVISRAWFARGRRDPPLPGSSPCLVGRKITTMARTSQGPVCRSAPVQHCSRELTSRRAGRHETDNLCPSAMLAIAELDSRTPLDRYWPGGRGSGRHERQPDLRAIVAATTL